MEDLEDDDGESGELIPEPVVSVWDTEISPGDLVHFRLHHAAFAGRPWPELLGFVRGVFGGHEVTYLVQVVREDGLNWERVVARKDILRAWVPENKHG